MAKPKKRVRVTKITLHYQDYDLENNKLTDPPEGEGEVTYEVFSDDPNTEEICSIYFTTGSVTKILAPFYEGPYNPDAKVRKGGRLCGAKVWMDGKTHTIKEGTFITPELIKAYWNSYDDPYILKCDACEAGCFGNGAIGDIPGGNRLDNNEEK